MSPKRTHERAGESKVTLTENEVDEMLITCREVTIVDVYRFVLYQSNWLIPEGKASMCTYVDEHKDDHVDITGEHNQEEVR